MFSIGRGVTSAQYFVLMPAPVKTALGLIGDVVSMNSEDLFAKWLKEHRMRYERHFNVNGRNVDFLINSQEPNIYCDVKEVRESKKESVEGIDAHGHIRSDIRKLRAKFKKPPEIPVVLVTMNYSSNFFTGLTVVRALMGDIGFEYDRYTIRVTKELHHLPRGNASLTKKHNRVISGVLVFEGLGVKQTLFQNPYANHHVISTYFPETDIVVLDRNANSEEIQTLSNRMFWSMTEYET